MSAQLFCQKLMMMDGALHSHTGTAECMCWLKSGADVLAKMTLLINMNGLTTSQRSMFLVFFTNKVWFCVTLMKSHHKH